MVVGCYHRQRLTIKMASGMSAPNYRPLQLFVQQPMQHLLQHSHKQLHGLAFWFRSNATEQAGGVLVAVVALVAAA